MTDERPSESAMRERVMGYIRPILELFRDNPGHRVLLIDETQFEGDRALLTPLHAEDVRAVEEKNPGLEPPENLEKGRWVLYVGEGFYWLPLEDLAEVVRVEARKRGILPADG